DASLIVVGNKRVQGVAGRVLGSIARDVAAHASCDVYIAHTHTRKCAAPGGAGNFRVGAGWGQTRHVPRKTATASSYSITMRLHTSVDHGVVGEVATAIAGAGGMVTAIDVAESSTERLTVDVTCSAADA